MSAPDRAILVADGDPRPELARRGVAPQPTVGALPLPVREPAALRAVHLEVALAGADVLTAVTGSLHRRTLSRMGAARRGREWIAAALDLAREAAAEAEDAGRPARDGEPAPPVRVAGLVGPLEGSGTSGLILDVAASAAEHRAHAGMLADAGAQLLRIEAMETVAESEAATREAVATGLETWTGVAVDGSGLALTSGEPLEAWAAVIAPLGPGVLLVTAPTLEATCVALEALRARTGIALGGSLPGAGTGPGAGTRRAAGTRPAAGAVDAPRSPSEARSPSDADAPSDADESRDEHGRPSSEPAPDPRVAALLDAGGVVLSAGTDGSPGRVALLRAEADRQNGLRRQRHHRHLERRRAWLAQVTDRALPGPALWLARTAPEFPLPEAFAWDVVEAHEVGRLPAGRYRMAVAPASTAASGAPLTVEQLRRLVTALEPGAWILVEGQPAADVLASDARTGALLPAARLSSGPPCWMVRLRP